MISSRDASIPLGKIELCYGTAAARIKLPLGSGLWPAFWAVGDGRWPDAGKTDIMEYVGEPDWTSVALHGPGYKGETPIVNKFYFPKSNDATAWHIYSLDWSPHGFVFRVDERVVYRATRQMIEDYGPWRFDNRKFLILNLAIGGAYPEKTNRVKIPYPGLPETAVERIKEILSIVVDEGFFQAAISWDLTPSMNGTPAMTSGSKFDPLSSRHLLAAESIS